MTPIPRADHAVVPDLLPCPFCGATPHKGLGKLHFGQLHGEPLQDYSVWCPHGCARITKPRTETAYAAWNTRLAAAPKPAMAGSREVREAVARVLYACAPIKVVSREKPLTFDEAASDGMWRQPGHSYRLADALIDAGLLTTSVDGYANAFCEIAKMLGIGARARSPKEVWEAEMRPKLLAVIGQPHQPCDRCGKPVKVNALSPSECFCSAECAEPDTAEGRAVSAPSDEQVECAARAIYEEDDPWHKAWHWPNLNPEAQGGEGAVERYRAIAHAALLAALSTPEDR